MKQSKTSIRIEGHTDYVGSADLNARLSEARAQSVKTALVKACGLRDQPTSATNAQRA